MESQKTSSEQKAKPVESVPEQPLNDDQANSISGGAMRRGGDDDLDDLEVER